MDDELREWAAKWKGQIGYTWADPHPERVRQALLELAKRIDRLGARVDEERR